MQKLTVTEKVALLFKSYTDMKRTGFHTDTAFEEWRNVVAEVRELETETQRLRELVVKLAEALQVADEFVSRYYSQYLLVPKNFKEALALAQPYIDLAGEK